MRRPPNPQMSQASFEALQRATVQHANMHGIRSANTINAEATPDRINGQADNIRNAQEKLLQAIGIPVFKRR